jgi:adenine-specific DNA-methyltransferase
MKPEEIDDLSLLPEKGARPYRLQTLTSEALGREKGWFAVELDGVTYRPSMQARWKTNEAGWRGCASLTDSNG